MGNIGPVVSAAFGGIAPNLLALGIGFTAGKSQLPEITYLIGLVIFASMGAAIAIIWKEMDLKRAFYLGVGLPSLIQLSVNDLTRGQDAQNSIAAIWAKPAYAQQNPIPARTLNITSDGNGPGFMVIFSSSDDKRRETHTVEGSVKTTLNVPDYASSFFVRIDRTMSTRQALSRVPNLAMNVTVIISKRTWSGFLQSIGVRNVEEYAIEVERN